jgi:NADH dehydrogenase
VLDAPSSSWSAPATTGTELAAQGRCSPWPRAITTRISAQTTCAGSWSTWRPTILAELGERLSRPALRILRGRGVDVRLRTTVEEVTAGAVRLSDGTTVPTRTLVWCVGVTLGPLTQALGLKTEKGRIVVDEYLTVPGHRRCSRPGTRPAPLTRPDPAGSPR